VSPGSDAEAFVQKAVAILQNPALAVELGRANRERAARRFAIPTMVDAYVRLYESLLAGRRPG
jgi:glycosyltransferase involved in cell wall biosynthesis